MCGIVFKELDGEFLKVAKSHGYTDGTTCCMGLIHNGKLTIANLGDSSALLIRNNQLIELSSEQNPSRVDEYQRIIAK